ncbi:MAG: LysM peptidoglycan-binding domain-containing protein [Acidobacteria bacterium]|nr:MAG: LysM peptidoglycan-binding domain-containing protein [Acidobacteriota bacterium]
MLLNRNGRVFFSFCTPLCLAVLATGTCSLTLGGSTRQSAPLQFPEEGFETAIDFWTRVFTAYGENEYLLHDPEDLRLVYRVVSVRAVEESQRPDFLRKQKEQMRDWLRQIGNGSAGGSSQVADLQNRLRMLDYGVTPALTEKLAGRLRYQRGIRERFQAGLVRSGAYFKLMRQTLAAEGVPEDLAYLPHVESSFAYDARSRAGAVGVWQLMSGTGRPLVKINWVVDERLDPIRATQAAARILKTNCDALGNWPLAITAYNHGRNGMARARAQFGDDLRKIIGSYQSPAFGFASKNFYAEFLAARRIAKAPAQYFGAVHPAKPVRYRSVVLERSASIASVAAKHRVSRDILREYNPHLGPRVWAGRLALPAGLEIRLPEVAGPVPDKGYRVAKGDTLTSIARRFGLSVEIIQQANGLADPHKLLLGQILLIP